MTKKKKNVTKKQGASGKKKLSQRSSHLLTRFTTLSIKNASQCVQHVGQKSQTEIGI